MYLHLDVTEPKRQFSTGQVKQKSHVTLVHAIGEKHVKCQTLAVRVGKAAFMRRPRCILASFNTNTRKNALHSQVANKTGYCSIVSPINESVMDQI